MRQNKYIKLNCCVLLHLLLLIVSQEYATTSSCSESKVVNFLPGFSGKLPFKLHTGYIGVGKGEEVQLFYNFVESEHDPESDPLMLWFPGGPGCTGLTSFFFEHLGPLSFNYTGLHFNFTTSTWMTDLPSLQSYPYSWTKFSSIIFLDTPAGAGFSYAKTPESYYTVDVIAAEQIYEFVQKWFKVHPQYATNPFYVGASSYSGLIAPFVAQQITKGNEDEHGSKINLKGYVLGSPVTDTENPTNLGGFQVMHRASILSDELYELSRVSCGNPHWNVSSAECDKNIGRVSYIYDLLNHEHMLEPKCNSSIPNNWCWSYNRWIINNWLSNARVRKALHVREETVGYRSRCSHSVRTFQTYNKTIISSIGYHQYLSSKPIRALIHSGDQELSVTYISILRCIKKLNLRLHDRWRPWFVNDQVAGYVSEYSNGIYNLTYTTIKGGGHCPSEYKPRESFVMFQRWISSSLL